MTDHVSDLTWDRLLAGDLTEEAGVAARTHARDCVTCASRWQALRAGYDTFQIPMPALPARPSVAARREPKVSRWWRWLVPLVPAAAVGAALLLISRPREPESETRTKGAGIALLLATQRAHALVPVASGDVVHPGEALQARYSADRDGFGAVLSRDGAGDVAAYVPAGGDVMIPLPAGHERSYPESTILDGVLGLERIILAWCETAYPLAPLLAQLRAGGSVSPAPDCVMRELQLDKRAASR